MESSNNLAKILSVRRCYASDETRATIQRPRKEVQAQIYFSRLLMLFATSILPQHKRLSVTGLFLKAAGPLTMDKGVLFTTLVDKVLTKVVNIAV